MRFLFFIAIIILPLLSSCVPSPKENENTEPVPAKVNYVPIYAVVDKQEYPSLNKNSFEIIIPEAYDEDKLKAVIYDLPNDNGRNVFATINIEGMSKASMAYAAGQIFKGDFTIHINMDFTEYPEEEHPGCTVIGQWVVYGSDTYVIYEKDNRYFGVFASKGKWGEDPEELKKYKQNGHDTFEVKKENDSKEFMEIHDDGLHIDSKKEPCEVVWIKAKQ